VTAATLPSALEVRIHDTMAGTIVAISARDSIFAFDETYIQREDRPVLSLGFTDSYGRLRTRGSRPGRILPFFANLLPEGALRRYIAERAGIDDGSDLALLWLTGSDLPGAVTVRDPEGRAVPPLAVGGPSAPPPADALFRFSLAGVQLKFSALRNARGGLTIPVTGRDGHYIVKLPSAHFKDLPLNEYKMMQFARDVGLDVPDCELSDLDDIAGLPADLEQLGGQPAFVVRRFDRADDGARIHIEDFNQLFRQYPDQKYDNHDYNEIARVIYRLMGAEALADFVRRLVFSMAIGNTDMHLKNWTVIYRDGKTPALAPVYDYLCTSAYGIAGRNELGLNLGGVKTFSHIGEDAFERLARRADVSSRLVLTAAREMRSRVLERWPQLNPELREECPPVCDRIRDLLVQTPFFQAKRVGTIGEKPSAHEEPA